METENNNQKKCHPVWVAVVTFIVTTFLLLGFFAYYIVVKNPFNIQACMISSFLNGIGSTEISETGTAVQSGSSQTTSDKHPLLSDTQEKALESAGINVESLPSAISPEVEACFVEILGQEKVNTIKAGAAPSALDIFRAKSCLD